ncbi:MAG TPA: zinc-ribbon and DUF3426 domain-containing protein [Rhodanobacteraceae bacterium]|nr:zinc-ribbon and DUF3426 domain-containing protein [Rhodanobacteraceae bacterium]
MYTQCPECLTVYEIDEDALQASLGIVRCGHCATRFDALRALSDTMPAPPLDSLPGQDQAKRAPTLAREVPASVLGPAAKKPQAENTDAAPAQTSEEAPGVEAGAAGSAQAGESSDDWFSNIESELAATANARNADNPEPGPDGGNEWAVELPDGIGAARTGIDSVQDPGDGNDKADATPAAETLEGHAAEVTDADTQPESAFDLHETEAGTLPDLVHAHDPDGNESAAATPTSIPAENEMDDVDAETAVAPAAAETGQPATEPDAATVPAPMYVRPRRRFSRTGAAWALGCLALALLLALQLAWAGRAELFRNPATQPWMARICASIPCQLPLIKNTAKLELTSRDVRPDPETAGALTITATLRNNAAFSQPWPVVVVKFTDLDNNPVAMRRFRPAEYMPDPGRRAAGIAPGETAAVAFEVVDPGKRATGFQFGFE